MLPAKVAPILLFVAIAKVSVGYASAGVIGEVGAAPDEQPARRVHVRGDVMRTRLKHSVEPAYPPIARKQGVEGIVKLQIIVSIDGAVKQVKVLSGPTLLTKAAVDAVLLWQYEPTRINDQPVEVETNINVVFSLKVRTIFICPALWRPSST